MLLLTKENLKALPDLYFNENKTPPTPMKDVIAHVKWFTPDANWTWYVCEKGVGEEIDTCWGYVIGFEPEWGYFSLDEIAQTRGRMGLPVERDLSWKPGPVPLQGR